MTRYRLTTVIMLVLPLLLLPLQGHARSTRADLGVPCAMEHQTMHGSHGMAAEQANPTCNAGIFCATQCLDCASCLHSPVGVTLTLDAPPARHILQRYTAFPQKSYSSVSLFKDHPPPRFA